MTLPRLGGWLRSLLHRSTPDDHRCWWGVANGAARCPHPVDGPHLFCRPHLDLTHHINQLH